MSKPEELTDEQWDAVRGRIVSEANVITTWVDDVGGIHFELIFESSRIVSLRSGNRQFGHGGTHHGRGTVECPTALHHHCDDFCASPSSLELMEAGINPRTFVEQGRA